MTKKLLYDVSEAVEATNLSRSFLFEELGAGRLESLKVGRRRLIPAAALEAYVERLRAESAAATSASR